MTNRLWRLGTGSLLSIAFIWLAVRGVSWVEMSLVLGSVRWSLIVVAVACVLFATLLRAWCWRRLLVVPTASVTLVRAWRMVLIGQFLNICVPARVGDVARIYLMGEAARIPKAGAATSLVLEKFFDAMTLLLLLGPLSLLLKFPAEFTGVRRGFAAVALLLLLAVLAVAWRGASLIQLLETQGPGNSSWMALLARQGKTIVESLRVLRCWQGLALMQAGYLGIWCLLAGVNHAVLRALGIYTPVAATFVVLIVLQLGVSVPSTPGKIGVFQYLAVLALMPFEVGREPALAYGLLLHVVGFGPLVVLGGLFSWAGMVAKSRIS